MDRPCISLEKYQNITGYIDQSKLVKNLLMANTFYTDDIYMPKDDSNIDTWITFPNINTYIKENDIDTILSFDYALIYSEYGVWLGMTYTGSVDNTISKLAELLFGIDLTDEELQKLKTNNTETEYMVVR